MFARVRVAMAPPAQALLVPDTAIGTEQVRKFVFVLDADNVAQPRYVSLGRLVDGLRVIKSGLKADDRVVINGLMRVRPGARVAPQDGAIASAAPDAPDTKSE